MQRLLVYRRQNTWIDRLTGVSKLLFFLFWSLVGMISYDLRVLLVMAIASLILFAQARIRWQQIRTVFAFMLVFISLNLLFIFIFSPYEGCRIFASRTEVLPLFGGVSITAEQLFYEANVMLKYFLVIPAALIFVLCTDPSEFAASLNRVGLPYGPAYAVALTLRYFPDVQKDYQDIKHSQEARGLDLSRNVSFRKRLLGTSRILFPLVFSSMERIDSVAQAMALRGFGRGRKRSWYAARPFALRDGLFLAALFLFCGLALWITFRGGSRFWNPFH